MNLVQLLSYFILGFISEITALRCLSCSGVISPRHCHVVDECDQNEVCIVEKYENSMKEILYNVGCYTSNACATRKRKANRQGSIYQGVIDIPTADKQTMCVECCSSDACNSVGCGAQGYPSETGPLCYSCRQSRDPTRCPSITVCPVNYMCHISEIEEFGEIFFTTNCRSKHLCHESLLDVFGKKKRRSLCSHCCDTDFCNDNCNSTSPNSTSSGQSGHSGQSGQSGSTGQSGQTHSAVTDIGQYGNCLEIQRQASVTKSGHYYIYPDGKTPVTVLCDMDTDGGGWTVIQRRADGSVDFYQNWAGYKIGFGNLTEYWIGNENIHALTKTAASLFVELETVKGEKKFAKYGKFSVGNETNNYQLAVGSLLNATLDDQLQFNDGKHFSTFDRDHDESLDLSCAQRYHGGWWYGYCSLVNLNGIYKPGGNNETLMMWFNGTDFNSYKTSKMMIR